MLNFLKNGALKVRSFCKTVSNKVAALVATGTAVVASVVAPKEAMAVPVDLTAVTSAVDFSTVITALLLVAAALAGVYIAWKGAKMILSAIRGG